jgi:hypothetical protein
LIAFVIILANHSENHNETRLITWDGIRQNAVDYLIGLRFAKLAGLINLVWIRQKLARLINWVGIRQKLARLINWVEIFQN